MRKITLEDLFTHPSTIKYLHRSGTAHAVAAAYYAFKLAIERGVNPDYAAKAALLHDIGHYEWYTDGKWDYNLYRQNDIHAIKGAERAHRMLIQLGEDRAAAKEIAVAILLHTDSYLPQTNLSLTPLQEIVKLADELDEEPNGNHHRRQISEERALRMVRELDKKIDGVLEPKQNTI
ncbi:HD domain-containing protein [Metabacillus sp. GX 13764]|uniref:HD domain-containing protein n=1 Tax=Metabacillus kandeliae TaxID=2900151 RepID=UPI001E38A5D9|nr:HD domain-containing protein [Metabacillus kandeliae]MCD7036220.1 HD domain-containing protein [Metabacillus kandeliae]